MSEEKQRDSRVSLAVYENTKDEWEQAVVEDPNADSLSQLIRVAVSQYLHDEYGSSTQGMSEEVHAQLNDLNSHQEATLQRLDQMNGRLGDVREALAGTEVDAETEALADEIFEVLPSEQDLHTNSVFADSTDDGSVPAPEPGTIEWLSERFDVPRYQIQAALDHLQEMTYAVQQAEDGIYYTEM
jgi:hypothetical protein